MLLIIFTYRNGGVQLSWEYCFSYRNGLCGFMMIHRSPYGTANKWIGSIMISTSKFNVTSTSFRFYISQPFFHSLNVISALHFLFNYIFIPLNLTRAYQILPAYSRGKGILIPWRSWDMVSLCSVASLPVERTWSGVLSAYHTTPSWSHFCLRISLPLQLLIIGSLFYYFILRI